MQRPVVEEKIGLFEGCTLQPCSGCRCRWTGQVQLHQLLDSLFSFLARFGKAACPGSSEQQQEGQQEKRLQVRKRGVWTNWPAIVRALSASPDGWAVTVKS